jgi:hypothetical protein
MSGDVVDIRRRVIDDATESIAPRIRVPGNSMTETCVIDFSNVVAGGVIIIVCVSLPRACPNREKISVTIVTVRRVTLIRVSESSRVATVTRVRVYRTVLTGHMVYTLFRTHS